MYSKQPVRAALALVLAGSVWCGGWSADLAVAQEAAEQAFSPQTTFDLIPAGADIAIVIPDLARFGQKMAMVNRLLELDSAGMADVMEEFRSAAGMRKGVADRGGAVVSMSLSDQASDPGRPAALLVLPVSDYASFTADLGGDDRTAITALTMSSGMTVHCKKAGAYAVLGARKDMVAAYQPSGAGSGFVAGGTGGMAIEQLASSDVAVVLNIESMRPLLTVLSEGMLTTMQERFAEAPPVGGKIGSQVVKAVGAIAADAVRGALRDISLMALTVDISEDGIALTAAAQFRAGSDLAALFGESAAGAQSSVLAKFPADPYLKAESMNMSGIHVAKVVAMLETYLTRNELPWLAKIVDSQIPVAVLEKIKSASSVSYMPDQVNMMSMGAQFGGGSVIETDDARGFVAAFRAYVEGLHNTTIDLPALPGPSGTAAADAPPIKIKLTGIYNSDAQEVIDNVQIDLYSISYDLPFPLMTAVGPEVSMALNSVREKRGFVAVVDKFVIMTSTDDDQLLRAMLSSVKQNKGLGKNKGLTMVAGHLQSDAAYRGYLSIADIVASARAVITASVPLNEAPQWSEFEDLPPIGWALVVNQEGVAKRLFLPMGVIKAAKDPAKQIYKALTSPQLAPEMVDQGQVGQRRTPANRRGARQPARGGRPPIGPAAPGGGGGRPW